MNSRATKLRFGARRGALVVAIAALVFAGCSSVSPENGDKPDNGTQLTMWARSGTVVPPSLVKLYNSTHKNQVKLTVIPSDGYQQKVGAAAGSNSLPDILASDVVFSPNYTKQGLFKDITKQVKALPFLSDLSKAHIEASTRDGVFYGVPLVVDSSLLLYNKDLFTKAGLDPAVGPKNFDDIYKDAKAVRALGGNTYGFYFAGNCPGCNGYTMFPYAVAAGTPPLEKDGTKANLDSPAFKDTMALYKKMTDEGIVPSGAKTDDGTTWSTSFLAGNVGILPSGSFLFGDLAKAKFDWGIAPLPAPDGSATSTFVGGDMVGVSKNSKHTDQSWNFIEWMLGDEAQVDVIAKSGQLPSRVDLADNKYSNKDPRIVAAIKGLANGYTPSAIPFGQIFNASTGPWIQGVRDYIYGDKPDALGTMQKTAQSILDQSK